MLKFFVDYPYVVYSILTAIYILIFIKWDAVKRLWPVAILGGGMIFITTYWLMSLGLYKINITFLPIAGIPFFLILWGALSGIVFAYYLGEGLFRRLFVVFGFAGITTFAEKLVENVNRVEHLGKFNDVYQYGMDVVALMALAFLVTNIMPKRLGNK